MKLWILRPSNYIKSDSTISPTMKSTGIAIVLTEIEHHAYINLNSKITKFGWIEMSEAIGS